MYFELLFNGPGRDSRSLTSKLGQRKLRHHTLRHDAMGLCYLQPSVVLSMRTRNRLDVHIEKGKQIVAKPTSKISRPAWLNGKHANLQC